MLDQFVIQQPHHSKPLSTLALSYPNLVLRLLKVHAAAHPSVCPYPSVGYGHVSPPSLLYSCSQRQRRAETLLTHTSLLNLKGVSAWIYSISRKSAAHGWRCSFYWAFSKFSELIFFLSPPPYHVSVLLFHVAPLMKSGGSVISSIVPRAYLFPNSTRSSKRSAGPADRNSLPCRYQSPSLLTIILICAFPPPFHSQSPSASCPLQENKVSLWLLLTG